MTDVQPVTAQLCLGLVLFTSKRVGLSPVMDMGSPQNVSQGRRSTHALLTDFVGLQGQGTIGLHPCVGKPLLLTCNLGLHTAS